MDAVDLAFAGLACQAELVAAGEVSSRELTQLCLDRIAEHDPKLNAFRSVYAERALAEADQADARRKGGDSRPLLGVPFAIKDEVDVAGDITAVGTNAYGEPAREDADVVRRLRAAGAVIIGKTNVPELTIHGFTETPTWGATRNPWDLQRTPGGSSGGSAAAVAAGLVGGALATDGAGSIRIPAGACGLVGLKPHPDVVDASPDLDHWQGLTAYGAVTRRAADSAIFYAAVGRGDIAAAAAEPPRKLRIAVSRKVPPGVLARLEPEQAESLELAIAALRGAGHEVVERERDQPPMSVPLALARYFRGIADDADRMPHPERLSRRTKGYARTGRLVPDELLRRAREIPDFDALNRVLSDADVLLTPMFTRRPPRIGAYEGLGALRTFNEESRTVPFCAVWNHTGQPAMSLPAGFAEDGFPRAVQFVAPRGGEGTLLALAAQLEGQIGWPERRPPDFS